MSASPVVSLCPFQDFDHSHVFHLCLVLPHLCHQVPAPPPLSKPHLPARLCQAMDYGFLLGGVCMCWVLVFLRGVISFSGSPDLGPCLCSDNHLAVLPVLPYFQPGALIFIQSSGAMSLALHANISLAFFRNVLAPGHPASREPSENLSPFTSFPCSPAASEPTKTQRIWKEAPPEHGHAA